MTNDEQIAVIREKHKTDVMVCGQNASPFCVTNMEVSFLLDAIEDRDATIAKLTAERDAAAAKERERIVKVLRGRAAFQRGESDTALTHEFRVQMDALACENLSIADALARDEGGA